MSNIDPILGYNHVVKKEIWDGYQEDKLPSVISACHLEWAPNDGYLLDDPSKPKCPECFADNRLSSHLKAQEVPIRFITLPAIVEAKQLKSSVTNRIFDIINWGRESSCEMNYLGKDRGLMITNRDGNIRAIEDDWIVKRPDGIFIAMRPDTFWSLYEARP